MIRALVDIRSKLVMINPDASAVSDSDAIIIQNMGDLQVLQNDIVPMINIDTGTGDVSG